MSELKKNKNSAKIKEYDLLAFFTMIGFIGFLVYFLFSFWTTGRETLRVANVINYWADTSSIAGSPVLGENSIEETNRFYETTIKLREDKITKLKSWSKEERTKLLLKYQNFYNLQISKSWDNDYHRIVAELTGIANKAGVKILGVSIGNQKETKAVSFTADNRYAIYERPVTVDIVKLGDSEFGGEVSVNDYEKLRKLLHLIRNDVKMPYNASFEVAKQSEKAEGYKEGNVVFDKLNLIFFYKHKK